MSTAAATAVSDVDAQIVASHGQRLLVETQAGDVVSCFARSRLGTIVCGDRVRIARTGSSEGMIEAVHARSSLIYRSDRKREKAIAANVSQAVVVLANTPRPNAEFIDRCLAAIEHAGVKALLLQNKIDLDPQRALQRMLLARYGALGYPIRELCAHAAVEPLTSALQAQASLLIGQSGVGKSTIVNALLPFAGARTGEMSRSEAGRHTTTHARLYRLGADTTLIDSPGMHQFGLQHIAPAELAACFIEFRPLAGQCRFNDCRHADEPGCALHEAVRQGEIAPERMRSYERILNSLEPPLGARSGAGRAEPARHRHQRDDDEP
ncbi:MAG: ribosome small subunit-dependent GTPase A [Betaproteobacteria bacterium]|nr:ribosome small subunit-dependent GTPase A [Betaproteobacteria bacterium]